MATPATSTSGADLPEVSGTSGFLTVAALKKSYRLGIAKNGEKAIEFADTNQPDVILLDIMMPGLDGQQTLVHLRQIEVENDMPLGHGAKVVMTSAMEDNQYIMQALNASADGYVVKPIERRKFIETLKETGLLMETVPKKVQVGS